MSKFYGGGHGGGGGAVSSVFGRVGAVIALLGDYSSSLISNFSTLLNGTGSVTDALNAISGNATKGIGKFSASQNDQAVSTGYASHAEGFQTLSGQTPQNFTIAPGGTLVTIAGDVRAQFTNTERCRIVPTAPVLGAALDGQINSAPVFAAGNTIFSLLAPIDLVTSAGLIVESGVGIQAKGRNAHSEGYISWALGGSTHAEGAQTKAIGPASHAEGVFTKAYGDDSHAEGESTIAGGIDSHSAGLGSFVLGFGAYGGGLATSALPTFGSVASGDASFAMGYACRTGNPVRTFTIPPNGITVTIPGDVTGEFFNGDRIPFVPTAPNDMVVQYGTIATNPVFGGVNTTFNLVNPLSVGSDLPAEAALITGGWTVDGQVGYGASCFGWQSVSSANYSSSIGRECLSSGVSSYSEGFKSVALGARSHAECDQCVARADFSHAEGTGCISNGQASHSEGSLCRSGNIARTFTVAAGGTIITIAGNVTSEFTNGNTVIVDPVTPIVKPRATAVVSSVPAFAAGNTTFSISAALNPYTTGGLIVDSSVSIGSHAEGISTIASGLAAHAEGNTNTASGISSHAEGQNNTASGPSSHAEGATNTASNIGSHVEGQQNTSSGVSSHAEGNSTQATGNRSHSEGDTTTASGLGSHAEGGGGVASANYAHAEGLNTIANQPEAHAEGLTCQATAVAAHAEGEQTLASGRGSHAEGVLTTASAIYSHAENFGGIAGGNYSTTRGNESQTFAACEFAEASGKFSAVGDNQYRRAQYKGLTPGVALGETVTLKDYAGVTCLLRSSVAYAITIKAIATKMALGAAARQTAFFDLAFLASVDSAGTVTISAVTNIATILQGAAFVAATLVPTSTGPNNLTFTFAIAGGLTIASRITASVEYIEVLGT